MTDPLDRARDYEDRGETCWRPKPGDVVGGRVVGLEKRSTQYDSACPVVILEQPGGDRVSVWALHTVLRDELKLLRPRVGDSIAIRRLTNADRGYARYKVFGETDDRGFSWDDVRTDTGDLPVNEEAPRSDSSRPVDPDFSDDLPF